MPHDLPDPFDERVSPAQDAPALRRAWQATMAVFLLCGVDFGAWTTQVPLLKARLGLDARMLGLDLLCVALGALIAMQAGGAVLQRFGAARSLRMAGLLASLFLAAVPFTRSFAMSMAVLFAFGFGFGFLDIGMNAHAGAVERLSGRPMMSSLHGGWSLGALAGSGVGALLLSVLSPQGEVAVLAGLSALAALVAAPGLAMMPPQGRPVAAERARSVPAVLRARPLTALLGALTAAAFLAEGAVADWSPVFLRELHHAAADRAPLGYAAFSAVMTLGRFAGDWLRLRLGDALLLRSVALSGALLAGAAWLPGYGGAVLCFGLSGIGLCNVVPILFSAATRTTGDAATRDRHATENMSVVATLGYTGVLGGPPLIGALAEASSLRISITVTGLLCLLIALLAKRITR